MKSEGISLNWLHRVFLLFKKEVLYHLPYLNQPLKYNHLFYIEKVIKLSQSLKNQHFKLLDVGFFLNIKTVNQ